MLKEYSKGANDEYKTPKYAIYPLVNFLPKYKTIWCPFDTPESNFVKILSDQTDKHQQPLFKVLFSHIKYGQDFFKYEPPEWDIIVSNPPFTKKRLFFERSLSFQKPFALLMTNQWLQDSAPKKLFRDRDLQLLMFEKRVHYEQNGVTRKDTPFSSSYFCWNLLPKQIIMSCF